MIYTNQQHTQQQLIAFCFVDNSYIDELDTKYFTDLRFKYYLQRLKDMRAIGMSDISPWDLYKQMQKDETFSISRQRLVLLTEIKGVICKDEFNRLYGLLRKYYKQEKMKWVAYRILQDIEDEQEKFVDVVFNRISKVIDVDRYIIRDIKLPKYFRG